jgi:hypothetical protein
VLEVEVYKSVLVQTHLLLRGLLVAATVLLEEVLEVVEDAVRLPLQATQALYLRHTLLRNLFV